MHIVRALALAGLVFLPAQAEFHRLDGTKKEVDIEALVIPERHNVFCFYADNNTICRALYPDFVKLGNRRLTEFQLIDVGSGTSPTSKKYALTSVPYFVIYNNRGKLVSEGPPAYKQVTDWIAGK
ncbi:MAG: thioredoxin family protein [Candidatus Eremiobacteraeota bacterium]|nr:thioredoxin family protein [Candidatus Eremiobacteraeota bacterium]MCW5867920.1 thioredoxin family protein [Candidatus Eremiobacteraeota bacterium]